MKTIFGAIIVALCLLPLHSNADTIDFRDSSFGSGSPFFDPIQVSDTFVKLSGSTSQALHDLINTETDLTTNLTVREPINILVVPLSFIFHIDEFLIDFNIELADTQTTERGFIKSIITSPIPVVGVDGGLIRNNIDAPDLSALLGKLSENEVVHVITANGFGTTAVPIPASAWLFISATLGLLCCKKRSISH